MFPCRGPLKKKVVTNGIERGPGGIGDARLRRGQLICSNKAADEQLRGVFGAEFIYFSNLDINSTPNL